MSLNVPLLLVLLALNSSPVSGDSSGKYAVRNPGDIDLLSPLVGVLPYVSNLLSLPATGVDVKFLTPDVVYFFSRFWTHGPKRRPGLRTAFAPHYTSDSKESCYCTILTFVD